MFDRIKTAAVSAKETLANFDWSKAMKKTFKVCRWFNIELCRAFNIVTTIHWSVVVTLFLFLILKSPLMAGLFALALVSVVPHEYGHALAAKYYKLKTNSILIYPVGGVALIESNAMSDMVKKKELVIAAAGPAVSFLLAAIGFLGVWLGGDNCVNLVQNPASGEYFVHQGYNFGGFWFWLCAINLSMVIFNLIPAFPMDGGRMFRATLSCWMSQVTATKIAYYVSVGICYLLTFIGLIMFSPSLMLIPLVVMWMARQELRRVEMLATAEAEKVTEEKVI